MYLKHKLFGAIFNILSIFPVKPNQISFITDKNASFEGNLKYIANEFANRKTNDGMYFEYKFIPKDKFSIKNLYTLARSKFVFLNDNFFPIAFMNFNSSTKIIQLWHAPGAFKKFGYNFIEDPTRKGLVVKLGEKTDYLTVTSKNVAKFYSEAFAIDEKKILPFGIPRLDYYSSEHLSAKNNQRIRDRFEKKYPNMKGKKLVLYAPTFRETCKNNCVFNYFDLVRFTKELGDEYSLLVRLHPKMTRFSDAGDFEDEFFKMNPNIIDLTHIKNEQELLLLADILITDYSSIMIEYAILNKPILFFAYDLDDYLTNERGFYFNYEKEVPGKIVTNMDQLIESIKSNDFEFNKLNSFLNFQFDYLDDNASKRIVDYLLED